MLIIWIAKTENMYIANDKSLNWSDWQSQSCVLICIIVMLILQRTVLIPIKYYTNLFIDLQIRNMPFPLASHRNQNIIFFINESSQEIITNNYCGSLCMFHFCMHIFHLRLALLHHCFTNIMAKKLIKVYWGTIVE